MEAVHLLPVSCAHPMPYNERARPWKHHHPFPLDNYGIKKKHEFFVYKAAGSAEGGFVGQGDLGGGRLRRSGRRRKGRRFSIFSFPSGSPLLITRYEKGGFDTRGREIRKRGGERKGGERGNCLAGLVTIVVVVVVVVV